MATDLKQLKIEAARSALKRITSGMKVGLGTGSTSIELVKVLAEALATGALKDIRATSTSKATEELARTLNIPMFTLDELGELDLTVDGADEIDPQLRLLKGLGGALLREKIVEQASRQFIVIADHTKLVDRLGRGRLPVEVVQFAAKLLEQRFRDRGLDPQLRLRDNATFITDEGHVILDIALPKDRDVADVCADIMGISGVVDTGFFPTEASEAVIAWPDRIEWRERPVNSL